MGDLRRELYNELRRIEEDSLYSMKGHYNASSAWSNVNLGLGVTSAVCASIAGLTSLANGYQWVVTLSALLSAIITALITFLGASEKSQSHKLSGDKFCGIRSDARYLYNVRSKILSDDDFVNKADEIRQYKNKVNSEALNIPSFAYKKAKKGIEVGEPNYEVDNDN